MVNKNRIPLYIAAITLFANNLLPAAAQNIVAFSCGSIIALYALAAAICSVAVWFSLNSGDDIIEVSRENLLKELIDFNHGYFESLVLLLIALLNYYINTSNPYSGYASWMIILGVCSSTLFRQGYFALLSSKLEKKLNV